MGAKNNHVKSKPDSYSQQIREVLEQHYVPSHQEATVDAYRYNSASVRVRVVDPTFKGKTVAEREKQVWEVLETLPDKVRRDLSMVLLLTPKESAESLLSSEFDDRSRSL